MYKDISREVKLFGLFKKKSEDTENTLGDVEPPVIIPPAKDRSRLPPEVIASEIPTDKGQFAGGGFIALKEDETSNEVFSPTQKLPGSSSQETGSQKISVAADHASAAWQALPKPTNIFSKPLPSPSTIAMIGSKKSLVNTSPAVTKQGSAEELIVLPLSLIIKAIPPDILTFNPDDAAITPEVASSSIEIPLREVLFQIPSGKIEFPLSQFLEFIPSNFFRKDPQSQEKIRLPLSEVINKLPPSRLGGLTANLPRVTANPLLVSGSAQSQELEDESRTIFGQTLDKAPPPTGGSGKTSHPFPEAPAHVLGVSKPKPPLGAIKDKILSAQNAAKSQQMHTQSAQADPNLFLQRQPDNHQFLAEAADTQPRQGMPPLIGKKHSAAAQTQPTPLFPKIAPPPPEALTSRADNTLPSISLAPTSKNKPPAIGGASRIGQTSSISSRENLATLAKLAAQQATQNLLPEEMKASEPVNPDALFKSLGLEKTSNHPKQPFSHEFTQSKTSGNLSALAASDEEIEQDQTTQDSKSTNLPNQSQSYPTKINFQAREQKKTILNRSMTDSTQEQLATPKHPNLPAPAQFGTQNFEAETAPAVQHHQDYEQTQHEQTQHQDTHPKPTIPFKTGLIKPVTKPTLFRSNEKSTHQSSVKLPANAFRLRPLENAAKSQTLPFNKTSTINSPQTALADNPQDNSVAFDVIPPPASSVTQSNPDPSEQPAPLARKAHTPFSSSTPSGPIRATASALRTGSTRGTLQLTFALARWLGLESDSPVPIESVPVLLTNSPYIKGAAVIDAEGLTLSSHLPHGISENAIGALTQRLYQQAKTAATEMGSPFEGQCVVSLGRWTLQITHAAPFYLATFHDGLDFPPALSRRLRKVAAALVRQETAS